MADHTTRIDIAKKCLGQKKEKQELEMLLWVWLKKLVLLILHKKSWFSQMGGGGGGIRDQQEVRNNSYFTCSPKIQLIKDMDSHLGKGLCQLL